MPMFGQPNLDYLSTECLYLELVAASRHSQTSPGYTAQTDDQRSQRCVETIPPDTLCDRHAW